VDLWRRLAASLSAAQWEYQATLEDRDAARLVLINSVVNTYYRLAYLNDALAEAEAGLKNLRSIEEKVLAKRQAGRGAAVEPAQAAQAALSAENNLSDYSRQRKTAEETLRNLLNLKPSEPLDLEGLTLDRLQLPELDLNVPLAVLAARPDLRAAEFRLRRAFKNVEEAEAAWLPSITVNAALSSEGAGFSQAFNAPVAGLGLTLNLPFLNWSAVLANLRISEADFEAARLNFEQALTAALNEVDRCYYIYQQASRELANTRKKYAYDLKIGHYYRDRYQSGAAELSDWLNAENTVNASRLAALNALYQTIEAENQTCQALAGRRLDQGG
jgi:outer membrane protein TolC